MPIGKFFTLPFFSKTLRPLSQECDYLGILQFLQMTLGTMKELFGITHVRDDEEEVPNVKRMCVVEEEVPVPQGPSVAIPLKGRGCLVAVDDNGPVPLLVSFSPFFFFSKTQEILLALLRTISLQISIDFDYFRVLFIVRFSRLNCLLIADCCQLHAAGKANF
jgi:hypothetical protein